MTNSLLISQPTRTYATEAEAIARVEKVKRTYGAWPTYVPFNGGFALSFDPIDSKADLVR